MKSNKKSKYKDWKKIYNDRETYSTIYRSPFYDIAKKYLPLNKNAVIIDIGTGKGEFVENLNLNNKYNNIYLLDGNKITIDNLNTKFKNIIFYKAPERLPFESSTVNFIHCSHLIEHLYYHELYQLLEEINRVLVKNGILIISTPLIWHKFYDDFSHVKPYNPNAILHYLCQKSDHGSYPAISKEYKILELKYRYLPLSNMDDSWGSHFMWIDFIIQFIKKMLLKLRIYKYEKTGYTLVLQKN